MLSRYLLCGRRVLRDADENDITIVGIFEDLLMQGFPVMLPRTALAWSVTREAGEPEQVQGRSRVFVDAQQVSDSEFPIDFQGQLSTRVLLNFAGIVVTGPGRVRFLLSAGGLEAEFAFTAAFAPGAGGGAPQAPAGTFIAA